MENLLFWLEVADYRETEAPEYRKMLAGKIYKKFIKSDAPMGIDIETDPLLFFPMIYWPVSTDVQPLSPETAGKVSAYLQSGGLIVFDTQDADVAMLRTGAPHPGLVTLLESIDIPPLAQIPPDHVLTRTFYLLQDFPGRFSGSPVWVEASSASQRSEGHGSKQYSLESPSQLSS